MTKSQIFITHKKVLPTCYLSDVTWLDSGLAKLGTEEMRHQDLRMPVTCLVRGKDMEHMDSWG
jgi:hypothetical protein